MISSFQNILGSYIFMFTEYFYFTSNHNTTRDFICQDDVHLNKDDTYILAGNSVNFIIP